MSLARPVFNLKAIEFVAFFAFFHLIWHLKVIQPFQIYAKTFYLRQAFKQKNRLEIALQVSKLGFSPLVMPSLTESQKDFLDWRPTNAFLHLFLFRTSSSFLSQNIIIITIRTHSLLT